MKKHIAGLGLVLIAMCAMPCVAATPSSGKIIVRVEDGAASRCINSATDKITMNLRRVVMEKKAGTFSEDKSVALVLNTTLSGNDGQSVPKKVSFPRMYTARIDNYSNGLVSVPLEEKLFSNFILSDGAGNSYDSTEIEFSLLAVKGQAKLGVALSTLADITKSLPLPINPFSEGFKFFTDYANKVVDASILEDKNVAATAKEGKLVLSFSPNSTCTGDQERTGTLAIVSGINGPNFNDALDISKEYCWSAQLSPVFTLKYANKAVGVNCSTVAATSFKAVNNPYIAFYLNAEPKSVSGSSAMISHFMLPPTIDASDVSASQVDLSKTISASYPNRYETSFKSLSSELDYLAERVANDLEKGSDIWAAQAADMSGQVLVTSTVIDSIAIDIAESLKRCAAHGIAVDHCL